MKRLFIRILNKFGFLKLVNLTLTTVVNNHSFKIPLIRSMGLENVSISELWMIQLLGKILEDKKGKVYVDVGVNLGQTLIKLKSVDPNIMYYGFEPNSNCIYYTKELIKANNFTNVALFPVGISDKTSIYELTFYSDNDGDSSASMLKDFRPTQKTYRKEYISCFNVSEIVAIPPIGILKIDVEGAEKEVIESFKEKIIVDQPYIQLEILPVYDKKNMDRLIRQEALENLFKKLNYSIFRILIDESNQLRSLQEVPTIGVHSNLKWCEYLIVPTSAMDMIKKNF